MCFAHYKMNEFERNPEKYIKKKCNFLFSRGYSLRTFNRNAEYCFDFYIKGTDKYDFKANHIYFLCENEYVDCQFSNINNSEVNIRTLNINFPPMFDLLTSMEKIDCLIDLVKDNIELIDVRPITKLQQALNLSKENKHLEAYPIFEGLYKEERNATNAFNLFQCAVYCGKTDIEKELYKKLKNYSPNVKKEPIELSGCFVRYYYGQILCQVNRNQEAIEIVDYLLDVISHYKITDSTFLVIRGIPTAQMIYELIKNTFVNDDIQTKKYKDKLISLLDKDTIRYDFKE